jgi:PAS domain-containing protein
MTMKFEPAREVDDIASALQQAVYNSANFVKIATDPAGLIQIFNVGAERMLGFRAHEVVKRAETGNVTATTDPLPAEVKTRIHHMLEVRLLYRQLEQCNEVLEELVRERTSELRESEARYRSLTELAADWYWEQDEHGSFVKASGPIRDLLEVADDLSDAVTLPGGWAEFEHAMLQSKIDARLAFLDLTRIDVSGVSQQFRISGEPIFNRASRFMGYRGVGLEISMRPNA